MHARVRVCARACHVCVCVCVCVCTRIKGFFEISQAKRRHTDISRKPQLQNNAATNTATIYRIVNCNKKCKHNLT